MYFFFFIEATDIYNVIQFCVRQKNLNFDKNKSSKSKEHKTERKNKTKVSRDKKICPGW